MTGFSPNASQFEPPAIAPVPSDISHRPLWSVMIPTFNCAKYLRQTLESVLRQDPGPEEMQIEVIDDCSAQDDPEAIVREIGKGRVAFYRKPKNEGAILNFNTCIQRSHGRLLHILHGDDYIVDNFYAEIINLRTKCPDASLLACRSCGVDESGKTLWTSPSIPELGSGGRNANAFYYNTSLQFSGVVVRRDFYTEHGGFLPALVHVADCEMWTRIISKGGGIVSNKVLSCYRIFQASDTGRLMRLGENVRDVVRLNTILANRFADFSSFKGRVRAGLLARSQAKRFALIGDDKASEANWLLWRELMPWRVRMKKRILKVIRR